MKKKNLFYYLMAITMMAMMSVNLTSCGSDDDGESGGSSAPFATPKYESDAAKYVISESGASYQSIELTASGEYIIVPSSTVYSSSTIKNGFSAFLQKNFVTRAGSSSQIIYGKFTKIADGEYQLEGFGKIKIEGNGGTACSLTITPDGGSTYTLTAAKQNVTTDSSMTNALCRSWLFDRMRLQLNYNGKTVDKTVNRDNLYELFKALYETFPEMSDGEPLPSEEEFNKYAEEYSSSFNWPSKVVFTKSGTYLVSYTSSRLAVSTWVWEDEGSGILRYSWNYEDMYSNGNSGTVNITFSDSNLVMTEKTASKGMDITMTYYMNELR